MLYWFQLSWQHLSRQHLSISGISQLLLPRFWPNFKSRFLGPSWTVPTVMVTCVQATFVLATFVHNQEYLSCYWPNFDQTSKVDCWDHLEMIPTIMATFVEATFVLATFVHIRKISAFAAWFWPNFKSRFQLSWQHLSRQYLPISGISQLLSTQFWPNFLGLNFFGPQFSWTQQFLEQNVFGQQP